MSAAPMNLSQPPATAPPCPAATIGFGNVLHSEWTKLRTVRSTYLTALLAFLTMIGTSALICGYIARNLAAHPAEVFTGDAATSSLTGLYIAEVAVGTLGVLVISSEYGTGMIRATLAAVPQRRVLLAAKAVLLGLATLIGGEVTSFLAFGAGQAILSTQHAAVTLAQPGVLVAVTGAGLYLTAVALLGFGLGALIRHTAGGLCAFFGLLFAPSALVDLLPPSLHHVINYMPSNAGSQIFTLHREPGALSPWAGLGIFCLYTAAALIAATLLITRRDT